MGVKDNLCEKCKGEGADTLVGDPVSCVDCNDTGRRHEDCNACGERFDWETGNGFICSQCSSGGGAHDEPDPDREWDERHEPDFVDLWVDWREDA